MELEDLGPDGNGYTMGRKPSSSFDNPDLTVNKKECGPYSDLDNLLSEAVGVQKAKFLAMDLKKTNANTFEDIEKTVSYTHLTLPTTGSV